MRAISISSSSESSSCLVVGLRLICSKSAGSLRKGDADSTNSSGPTTLGDQGFGGKSQKGVFVFFLLCFFMVPPVKCLLPLISGR